MEANLVLDELYTRLAQARAVAQACTEVAAHLVQDAAASRDRALQVRLDAIELRERDAPPRGEATITSFRIRGLVDDMPVEARFEDGRLICPDEVLRRAEVLVGMGETLGGRGTRTVAATLDGPPGEVLVTLMRALSRVLAFEVATERTSAR